MDESRTLPVEHVILQELGGPSSSCTFEMNNATVATHAMPRVQATRAEWGQAPPRCVGRPLLPRDYIPSAWP